MDEPYSVPGNLSQIQISQIRRNPGDLLTQEIWGKDIVIPLITYLRAFETAYLQDLYDANLTPDDIEAAVNSGRVIVKPIIDKGQFTHMYQLTKRIE